MLELLERIFWDDDANASTACAACPAGTARHTARGGGHLNCRVRVSRGIVLRQAQRGAKSAQRAHYVRTKTLQLSASPVEQATTLSRTSSLVLLHACRVCGEGRVDHDRVSSTPCMHCSAGRYAHRQSSVEFCSDCPAGRWSLLESSVCTPCPFGYTSLPKDLQLVTLKTRYVPEEHVSTVAAVSMQTLAHDDRGCALWSSWYGMLCKSSIKIASSRGNFRK